PVLRPLALMNLAQLYLVAGRPVDAVTASESLVALTGGQEARLTLARGLGELGRHEEALGAIDAAMAGGVGATRGRPARALGPPRRERPAAAGAAGGEVLATAPQHDAALAVLSRARAVQDTARAEIPRLRTTLLAAPDPLELVDARTTLAELLRAEGR